MRLIELPRVWTIIIDIMAWFVIHMGVVYMMLRLPAGSFHPSGWLYKERKWEKGGHIYQKVFKIKKWKKFLPDGAGIFKGRGFPKKELKNKNKKYLLTFQTETCRGELTHWFIMLFAPLFFLWNPFFVGWIMIVYAAVENLPLIMTQRYNRHRLDRILKRKRPAEFI